MSLVNVAYAAALTWGNPTQTRLEDQALVPMFGTQPIELGLIEPGTVLLARLRSEPRYQDAMPRAAGRSLTGRIEVSATTTLKRVRSSADFPSAPISVGI